MAHDDPTIPGGGDAAGGTGTPPPASAAGAAAAPPEAAEPTPAIPPEGEAPPTVDDEGVQEAEPEAPPTPEEEAARYLELARRTQADFENYRKRMAREQKLASDRGATKLAKELLPALDHLELALKAASGHEEIVRGFAMVHGELIAGLGRAGIEAFSPQGETFDPEQHEAMAQAPIEGAESGTVVEVYQRGYRLNGAVLRPARVVVAQ